MTKTELWIKICYQIFSFGATLFYFQFFFILPFIVIIDAYNKDSLPSIDSIQSILTIAYWTFCIGWIIPFYNVVQYCFWIHHVCVGGYFSLFGTIANANNCFENIVNRYYQSTLGFVVGKIVFTCMGQDIGSIVFEYWANIELKNTNMIRKRSNCNLHNEVVCQLCSFSRTKCLFCYFVVDINDFITHRSTMHKCSMTDATAPSFGWNSFLSFSSCTCLLHYFYTYPHRHHFHYTITTANNILFNVSRNK